MSFTYFKCDKKKLIGFFFLSLLSQTLNPNVIKPQDETSVLSAINSNIAGRDLAWNHFVANWEGLLKR